MPDQNDIIRNIANAVKDHVPVYPEGVMPETSSVLLPLVEHAGSLCLVYEQRSGKLETQPGEICFPGGRMETGETRQEAAVRETCEELLVTQNQIEVLGALDGVMGPSGAPVWPFVGILRDYQGTWSSDEVDHVIYVPLRWFAGHKPEVYKTKMITVPGEDFPYDLIPGGRKYHWREKTNSVYFYKTPEAVIWGLTGHITASFIRRISMA